MDQRVGFGSMGWDRLMVGLDRLIGGWIGWVDYR